LHSVACFAGEGHQGMFIQGSCLVIGRFEDRGTTHGRFGGSNEGEVFACEA